MMLKAPHDHKYGLSVRFRPGTDIRTAARSSPSRLSGKDPREDGFSEFSFFFNFLQKSSALSSPGGYFQWTQLFVLRAVYSLCLKPFFNNGQIYSGKINHEDFSDGSADVSTDIVFELERRGIRA
jgi:hypothetical protein